MTTRRREAGEWVTLRTTGPARPGPLPDGAVDRGRQDADPEWAAYVAWAGREAAAGRVPEPEPWVLDEWEPWDPELDGPGVARPGMRSFGMSSFGPRWRAADGPVRPLFARDGVADVMAPSPFLAALTEQAVSDVSCLSDSELAGVLRASRRLVARERYKQVLAAAEFGRRRRAAFQDALARGVPAGCAAGGFPGEELAIELTVSRAEAGHLMRRHRPDCPAAPHPGRDGRRFGQRRPGRVDRLLHPQPHPG